MLTGSPAVPKTAIPTRLIVPTLRTLHQLLAKGCLDELQGPKFTFAADLVRLTRLRVMKVSAYVCAFGFASSHTPPSRGAVQSTDAVRVMEGVSGILTCALRAT